MKKCLILSVLLLLILAMAVPVSADDGIPEEEGFPWLMAGGGSVIVGLVVALIVTGVMKGQLKSVRPRNDAGDYVVRDSLKLTHSSDLYLYSTVTKIAKPKNDKK